eukprot:1693583-Alexandrium_andersonii.AAC.1
MRRGARRGAGGALARTALAELCTCTKLAAGLGRVFLKSSSASAAPLARPEEEDEEWWQEGAQR